MASMNAYPDQDLDALHSRALAQQKHEVVVEAARVKGSVGEWWGGVRWPDAPVEEKGEEAEEKVHEQHHQLAILEDLRALLAMAEAEAATAREEEEAEEAVEEEAEAEAEEEEMEAAKAAVAQADARLWAVATRQQAAAALQV